MTAPAPTAPTSSPLISRLTCPMCAFTRAEMMPTDACLFFYTCTHCGTVLKPKAGDCCVFCSYGDTPCPPQQCAHEEADA